MWLLQVKPYRILNGGVPVIYVWSAYACWTQKEQHTRTTMGYTCHSLLWWLILNPWVSKLNFHHCTDSCKMNPKWVCEVVSRETSIYSLQTSIYFPMSLWRFDDCFTSWNCRMDFDSLQGSTKVVAVNLCVFSFRLQFWKHHTGHEKSKINHI